MNNTKYNILYVDDEQDNLDVFESTFWKDYNIHKAISGSKGLEVLQKENIHLVISDQRMPIMSGVEFLEQVTQDFPEPLRIILTGYSDMDSIVEAINKGHIYHYVTKPWNKAEFQEIINRALEVVRLKQENTLLLLSLQLSNKKLESLNSDLESKVKERTKELEYKNSELTSLLHELKK